MSVRDPRIRTARLADAEGINRCHVGGWKVHYRGILPDAFLDAIDPVERLAARRHALGEGAWPGVCNWVLEEEGAIRGWASTGPCRDEDLAGADGAGPEDVAHELYAIYLDPDLVGHGYGRALMSHCVAEARAAGHREMVMWVLTGNERARRFYAAAGFTPDPRTPAVPFRFRSEGREPADTGQTKLRLRRDL